MNCNVSKVLKYASFSSLAGIMIVISGCAKGPAYTPSTLDSQARGITIATSKPYNCKIEGELEATESARGKSSVTKESIREGAINNLKNEAVHAVKEGSKMMIKIDRETMKCKKKPSFFGLVGKNKPEFACQEPINPKKIDIVEYKIYADIYSRGEK